MWRDGSCLAGTDARLASERLKKQQAAEAAQMAQCAASSSVVENAKGAATAVADGAAEAFKRKQYEEAARKWGEALACLRAARASDTVRQHPSL